MRHLGLGRAVGRAGQKHRKKARAAGANDYLTKPYQELELVEKVSEPRPLSQTYEAARPAAIENAAGTARMPSTIRVGIRARDRDRPCAGGLVCCGELTPEELT